MYGKRRFAKKPTTSRSSYRPRTRPTYALKKVGSTYARSVEKKYFDKTYQSNSTEVLTGQTVPLINNGVTYISNVWGDYAFGTTVALAGTVSNNMLKGVTTGTTARSRIGNKVKVNYVKGAFTFTAAAYTNGGTWDDSQGGEHIVATSGDSVRDVYLRTTYRMVIVKDLQVNSADTEIKWNQVFDTNGLQAGVHSELNVDNMGRFIILQDKIFTVDADTPQKTCPYTISGSRIGSVRYNGANGDALTDKGVYVIWAAFVMGYQTVANGNVKLPSPVGHSRFCFSDE